MILPTSPLISHAALQQIWETHGMDAVRSVRRPARGSINPCFIVNDEAVIRFTADETKGSARFKGEALAYETLRGGGLPVPQVIALDLGKSIVPYGYLITSLLPGDPVIDRWAGLTPAQREIISVQAGQFLAQIHTHTFPRFGNLHELDAPGFDRWADYVADFFKRQSRLAWDFQIIDAGIEARMSGALARHQAALELDHGHLVHSDYHWENLLTDGQSITGIIDFEWALAGDPAWDFIVEDKWEAMCPGSRQPVTDGYLSRQSLPADFPVRVLIYKMLYYLESAVDAARDSHRIWLAESLAALSRTLGSFESG